MTSIPDLIKLSKLETEFHSEPDYVQHVEYVFGSNTERKKVRKEERWKRKRRLGRGGYATVWLEQCIDGDKKEKLRAVKEIPKIGSIDYNKELEAIALFSHSKYEQCFVKSFGWYENNDDIFLTMEYFPNGDLHNYLGSPLPEIQARCLVDQILEGLCFMHSHNFTHRDLKPNNILVVNKGPDWWVKIADFGISKRATDGLSAMRTYTGTLAYMAPEILASNRSYTNAVDIWALSVITFYMLTGELPFGDQNRPLMKYISGNDPFPLEVLRAEGVSEQGCDFIKSLMEPKPETRPLAQQCQQHSWLHSSLENTTPKSMVVGPAVSRKVPPSSDAQPSANWTTENPIPARNINGPTPRGVAIAKSESKNLEEVLPELAFPRNWSLFKTLKGNPYSVWDVVYSPNGKQLASAMGDSTIMLLDVVTGSHTRLRGHSNVVRAVAYSPDGNQLASASTDGTLRLWDMTNRSAVVLTGLEATVKALAYSPDGKQLVSGSTNGTIQFSNPVMKSLLQTFKGHTDCIQDVVYSPGGAQLASASIDGTIKLWDAVTMELVKTLLNRRSDPIWSIAYSPCGKQLASAHRAKIILWDPTRGAFLKSWRFYFLLPNVKILYSLDGKELVSASSDNRIRWFHPITGTLLNTSESHEDAIKAIAFSPDGRQMASASSDGTIKLWESSPKLDVPVEGDIIPERARRRRSIERERREVRPETPPKKKSFFRGIKGLFT